MKNLVLLFLLFFSQYFMAKAEDLFTVNNIEVEEKSTSSSEAKQIATERAKKDAFKTVLNKIMISTQVDHIINNVSMNEINNFVSEVEISNEQTSSTKYKANMNISFGMSLIGEYLKDKEYKFITDTPANTLMIPVAIGDDENILVNQTEKLINTINEYKQSYDNIIPIMIPNNIKNFLSSAAQHDIDTINKISDQYNTTSAMVIRIFDFGKQKVKLDFLKTDTNLSKDITWTFSGSSDIYSILSKLILQLSNDIYKQDIIDGKGYKGELIAVFAIKSISDILKIEDVLLNTKYINSVFVKAVSQNMIQVSLKTKTNKRTIINSLNTKGFVVEDKNNYILVR